MLSLRVAPRSSTACGQAFHKLLLPHQQIAKCGTRRVRLNAALHVRKFSLGAPMLQCFETTVRLFLCEFAGVFEQNFEQQAPIAIFQVAPTSVA